MTNENCIENQIAKSEANKDNYTWYRFYFYDDYFDETPLSGVWKRTTFKITPQLQRVSINLNDWDGNVDETYEAVDLVGICDEKKFEFFLWLRELKSEWKQRRNND